jgi:hypothetical protein
VHIAMCSPQQSVISCNHVVSIDGANFISVFYCDATGARFISCRRDDQIIRLFPNCNANRFVSSIISFWYLQNSANGPKSRLTSFFTIFQVSISGVRGIVGASLRPDVIVQYVSAFGHVQKRHSVEKCGQNFFSPLQTTSPIRPWSASNRVFCKSAKASDYFGSRFESFWSMDRENRSGRVSGSRLRCRFRWNRSHAHGMKISQ